MSSWNTEQLIADDKRYVWHPFTNMGEWCAPEHEPLVLVEGQGAILRDSRGREYIDGNSSIWTNIHGHNHPRINRAITEQLARVGHTSFLGATNPVAIELAREIIELFPEDRFGRVFFSDDGSTGIEAALRIVAQYWKLQNSPRSIFVSFQNGYHGDTAGAAALGATALFGGSLAGWIPKVRQVASVEELDRIPHPEQAIAAIIIEPIIQGAGGMKLWPAGTLRKLRNWCDETNTPLIGDEVMTAFGRSGKMFACEHEKVFPDIMILAKGLTGGYLPLALTVVSNKIFTPFSSVNRRSILFYGHSYTGSALGCAAALASLKIFTEERLLANLSPKIQMMEQAIEQLSAQVESWSIGMIGAIKLPSPASAAEVCRVARDMGLLLRPLRDVVILMPPLCITEAELLNALNILKESVHLVLTGNVSAHPHCSLA